MGEMSELYDYLQDEPEPMRAGDPCPDREWDDCDGTMVKRTNRHTGESFVGCSRFPRCRHTAPIAINLEPTDG